MLRSAAMKRPGLIVSSLASLAASLVVACSSHPLPPGEATGPDGGAGTSGAAGTTSPGTTSAAGSSGAGATNTGTSGAGGQIGAAGASYAGTYGFFGEAGTVGASPQDAAAPTDAAGVDAGTTIVCPPFGDGGTSSACQVTTVPSQNCTAAPVAIGASTLCAGASTCPVTMAARLACDVGCYPEISLAPRADGASILLDVANAGNPDGEVDMQLFTLGATSRVDHFPFLVNGVIAADRNGVRNVFLPAQQGAWRLRESGATWAREDLATALPVDIPDLVAARVFDDGHAFAAFGNGSGVSVGVRDATGWTFELIDGPRPSETALGMDVGADGRPWLSTVGYHGEATDQQYLDVIAPDRTYATLTPFDMSVFWRQPSVLAGGLTGSDARPAVAYRLPDGIHVASPSGASAWAQRLIPGSALLGTVTTGCPAQGQTLDFCTGDSCDVHRAGSGIGLGLARTASGAAFVAWLDIDSTDTYELDHAPPPCGQQGCASCTIGNMVGRQGSSALVVSRLPADPNVAPTVQRFPFADATEGLGTIALSTRGETLLVAVVVGYDGGPTDVRYLELDATKLP
jgi:hypothetical protein